MKQRDDCGSIRKYEKISLLVTNFYKIKRKRYKRILCSDLIMCVDGDFLSITYFERFIPNVQNCA